ncbi:MAG: U32 family peptidase [Clostridiales bacterium]|nr:U32 family peptidase [Clostridiales bacterium]
MLKPELLAPAGDMEKLRVAIAYGADAVYIGGQDFSLRARAGNFSAKELPAAVEYAHRAGKKLYVAVNVFARNSDIERLPAYLKLLAEAAPDALIISDLGVFSLAREYAPGLPLHISTQANTVNWQSAAAWGRLGAKRVILGRELTLAEVAKISALPGPETEIFVHGAMCMAYSGRCFLSHYLSGRDANRGDCAQPCRWRYALQEEKRPGEFFPVKEDARGGYILNSRDLCLIEALPDIIGSGVSAVKIEGRNKSAYYIANVTRVYRAAIDAAYDGQWYNTKMEAWRRELAKISHREYTTGFAFGPPGDKGQRYLTSDPIRGYDFAAMVTALEPGILVLEQRNHFASGDTLELLLPDGGQLDILVTTMHNGAEKSINAAAHPGMRVYLPLTAEQQQTLALYSLPLVVRRMARAARGGGDST